MRGGRPILALAGVAFLFRRFFEPLAGTLKPPSIEAASQIAGGKPAPTVRMAGRASPQRELMKMKRWP